MFLTVDYKISILAVFGNEGFKSNLMAGLRLGTMQPQWETGCLPIQAKSIFFFSSLMAEEFEIVPKWRQGAFPEIQRGG